MKINRRKTVVTLALSMLIALSGAVSLLRADTGSCGGVNTDLPFTDVAGNGFFCQIAAAYFSGLANGTSPTTYSPGNNVTREQMAAFTTRTLDQSLKRGSKRGALGQWWMPRNAQALALGDHSFPGQEPSGLITSDGTYVYYPRSDGSVFRWAIGVGSDSDHDTTNAHFNGAPNGFAPLVVGDYLFVTGNTSPGKLYAVQRNFAGGTNFDIAANNLGNGSRGLAFDGLYLWTANAGGSLSKIIPAASFPWAVETFSVGFGTPYGIIYDGKNLWVTDSSAGTLLKLGTGGNVLQVVFVGTNPRTPVFDGTNIWVPNHTSDSVTVVRAAMGQVLATLTGNGLNGPETAAFDGERILVTNKDGHGVSLWKATDLTPLGQTATGAGSLPFGACSDGTGFWITMLGTNKVASF